MPFALYSSKSLYGFRGARAYKAKDSQRFYKMLEIRSLSSSNYSKTTWNPPEQPAELTWKLAAEIATLHSWYCYAVTIVTHYYVVILML